MASDERKFDIEAFTAQINNASAVSSYTDDGEGWLNQEYELSRKEGLRVVLETSQRKSNDEIKALWKLVNNA